MNDSDFEMNRRAVRPMQCFREGWQLIKDDYWLFLGITFVGILVGSAVPFGILLGPMWCGIEICLLRRMRGERITFNYLFEGFNFFGQSVVATLFVMVPLIVVVMVLYFAFFGAMIGIITALAPRDGGPPDASFFGAFFGMIALYVVALMAVGIVVGAPFIFMYGLIVDRGLSGVEAVTMSFRAVFANLGGVLGLLLFNMLLSCAGSAILCIGAYLVMPITFAAYAVAYRQVFPGEQPREVVPVDEPEPLEAPPATMPPTSTGIQAEAPREAPRETGFTPGPPE